MFMFDLRAPKPGTSFVRHRDRLALFHDADEEPAYWRDYWMGPAATQRLEAAATGVISADFDLLWQMLARYVPVGSRVLEAGCGPGHAVAALNHHGYRGTGVDYVRDLVEFGTRTIAGLDLRVGDVEALPFADASFDGCASLGVVEHFEAGPERALAELYRVLRPGGFAYVDVPFLNPLRRAYLERLASRDGRDGRATAHAFHQYYFGVDEFTAILERTGFEVLEHAPNAWESVILREHSIGARLWSSRLAISRVRGPIRRVLRALPMLGARYGHMIAFGCRRRA